MKIVKDLDLVKENFYELHLVVEFFFDWILFMINEFLIIFLFTLNQKIAFFFYDKDFTKFEGM